MNLEKEPSKRAHAVRQRRSTRSRQPVASVPARRARKSSAPKPPPVLVRGGLAASLGQERPRKKAAKRRYDVALSTPGVEMRLPSLPSVQIGWRLVSGLMVCALAYLLYTAWNSPAYRVLAAEVQGAQRLTGLDINTVAGVAGEPVFLIEPEEVRRLLQASFPELSSVTVEVKLPAKVMVTVEERQPVLSWQQGDKTVWVDADGVAFPPRGEAGPLVMVEAENAPPAPAAAEVPEAGSPNYFLPQELVPAVLAMGKHSPEGKPLVYSNIHGLGWKDPRGWDVYFGTNVEDMDMKLSVYKAIAKRVKKEEIRPELISVEYAHAPYYRLEP